MIMLQTFKYLNIIVVIFIYHFIKVIINKLITSQYRHNKYVHGINKRQLKTDLYIILKKSLCIVNQFNNKGNFKSQIYEKIIF